ncbi:DNA polymerase IV [Ruminococcus bromii]|uniref:DNA polymerase Y family protein n=1 Tax=Ruminococcus bromii TaxID=40518 RepID=UPI00292D95C2|nr:DNA polymerase IV [Ruminococcus bromii]MDE8725586.1 DNA polymerase IV [Ruminococcus bromii]
MAKLVFHVDVNSAYLSWEAARRVAKGEPDIRLIPAVIGGDREKRIGVVLAKSIPAKKLGIKTGEPIGMALRKCPDLFMAKPDFRLYEENSKKFMDICREYAPVVEKASVDECYLDMSGTHRIYPDPVALAHTIKDRIRNELGFTVNVGIGDNKLLAKMASDFEKPDKVHTLFLSEIPYKMWPLPVGDLFTVGSSTADKLRQAKIMTIGDLAHTDLAKVQKIVGMKLGKHIHDYANGIDPSPVLSEPEEAKGYSISTTLEEDVKKATQAYPVLLALADSVTARIRSDGAKAFCVAVTIRDNSFKTRSHQRSLMNPTDISMEVYQISKELFDELWDGVTPLRLLGIAMTNITREETLQFSLFQDESREKSRKIDKARDALNAKFGSATIVRGSSIQSRIDVGKKYQAQMEQKKKGKQE